MSKKNGKKEKFGQKNTWLSFLDTVTNVIIIPILVLSVITSVVMINAKRNNNVPNIFGFSLVTILSESMTSSGFEIDDSVMVKKVDTNELMVGDIIAYYKYIEKTDVNLSDIAQASMGSTTTTTAMGQGDYTHPQTSKISSWKLYLSKLFSNATYTSTEASEKAIRARSSIIFHQIVDIVEYDGYKWFRTWGSSNVNAKGDPIYDTYWIREDYVIGKYTHTSSAVRTFLSFASTNSGILWMVEVPSGVHLILSTLELIEILDMMTRERHERIKNGTYIDRKEYKKMLRAKRKLLASGNIDVETFKKMYPTYENYDIFYSLDEHKDNVNINGPPISSDGAETDASTQGKGVVPPGSPPNGDGYGLGRDGPPGLGESPPSGAPPGKGRAPNGRDGPPNLGESPPGGAPPGKGRAPNGRDGPPNDDDSPPTGGAPPGAPSGRDGPPGKGGSAATIGESPPGSVKNAMPNAQLARDGTGDIKQIDKSLYKVTAGIYDSEDRVLETKEVQELASSTNSANAKKADKKGKNQIVLTEQELNSITDIYHWTDADFIANTDITSKGVIKKPNKNNKIYLVSNKTKKQYSLSELGVIYSVNTGLITSEKGLFRYLLNNDGVTYEHIDVDPSFTIISAKQDIFGNIFIGVKGGSTTEITKTTSDGKIISIWNRNALLTLGDNKRLYYMSMEGSYNLKDGKITDIKVMANNAKLVSVDPKKITTPIKFVDGYEKYGFIYLDNKHLCLSEGKLFFNLETKQTVSILKEKAWQLSQKEIAVQKEQTIYKLDLSSYLTALSENSLSLSLPLASVIADNVKNVEVNDHGLIIKLINGQQKQVDMDEFIISCHLNK